MIDIGKRLEIVEEKLKKQKYLNKILIYSFLCILILFLANGIVLKEQASDPTVNTNYGVVYTKTDNKLYFKNDAGTTYELTASGGSGDGHSIDADDGSPIDVIYVNATGEVGIGTTTPCDSLEVEGGIVGGRLLLYSNTTDYDDFITDGSWTTQDTVTFYLPENYTSIKAYSKVSSENASTKIIFRIRIDGSNSTHYTAETGSYEAMEVALSGLTGGTLYDVDIQAYRHQGGQAGEYWGLYIYSDK